MSLLSKEMRVRGVWPWVVCAVVVLVCGASAPATARSAVAHAGTPAHRVATAAPACTAAPAGRELLADPGFEGGAGARAASWSVNVWGGAAVTYARETTTPHGGSTAQSVSATTLGTGGAIFKQDVTLTGGTVYQASVWLRSPGAATVDFELRRAGPPYEPGAVQHVTLTPGWRRYTIRGGFESDTPAYFAISLDGPGTVLADDADLRALSDPGCVATSAPVPATYLGMHINKWGTYNVWPGELQFGTVRLWDTGTRWEDVEPQRGVWQWNRLDAYVNAATQNHDAVIYTMGMTPQWASARPGDAKNGSVAEPASLSDWRAYVHAVATRYKGRIRYWEIWNETDYKGFFDGSTAALVALTQAADEELQAVDPANVVLSPNFTTGGLGAMSAFLAAGGGRDVDVMSVHLYPHTTPEADRPFFAAAQDIMRRAGIGTKQLWNTEGAAGDVTSADQLAAGLLARTYLLQWSWGISNFDSYAWDISIGSALSQANHITPTAAGIAYEQVGGWLRGSHMLARSRSADGTWTITLKRPDGTLAHAVWNTNGSTSFPIPATWKAGRALDLAGGTTAVAGGAVTIGVEPVLLVP